MINRGKIAKRSLEILAAGALILGISLIPGDSRTLSGKGAVGRKMEHPATQINLPNAEKSYAGVKTKLLRRFNNTINRDNYYTSDEHDEHASTLLIYEFKEIIGCAPDEASEETIPLYRIKKYIKNSENRPYGFITEYTSDSEVRENLLKNGWEDAEILCRVYKNPKNGTIPLVKFRNEQKGANLLVTRELQKEDADKGDRWNEINVEGYIYPESNYHPPEGDF